MGDVVKVSWSGGKDSTCALMKHLERGDTVKAVCYIPMFTDTIPLLLKDHYEFILRTADKFRSMENVIYRAVGLHRNFEFDLRTFPVVPGGKYLLCTDGMYRSLSLEKLQDTLEHSAAPRNALDIFMRSALVSGGKDNITGIAVFAQGENNE